jgi:hypothetical protein
VPSLLLSAVGLLPAVIATSKGDFIDILSMYYHSHFIPFLLSYKFNILFQILKISN